MEQNKLYEVALSLAENIGSITLRHLVSYCGSAEAVFKANKATILKIPSIGEKTYTFLRNEKLLTEADKIVNQAIKQEAEILYYLDAKYPKRLKNLFDAPALLYSKGKVDYNSKRTIGIVGTRRASDYGKSLTESMILEISDYQPVIVSGLAYGIDITAHKAAIKNKVPTIAVLAGGLDKIYPKEHFKYLNKIMENGSILSERPFGVEPARSYFLARNRIIAALSDLVVVVESAAKGGSLVTAEYANNYHREVFAVPGNIGNETAEGSNNLIFNNKARIYTKGKDIIEALNWDLETQNPSKIEHDVLDLQHFSDEETAVITILKELKEVQIDELSWKSQISINKLASILLNLEFQGIVKTKAGKKFALC